MEIDGHPRPPEKTIRELVTPTLMSTLLLLLHGETTYTRGGRRVCLRPDLEGDLDWTRQSGGRLGFLSDPITLRRLYHFSGCSYYLSCLSHIKPSWWLSYYTVSDLWTDPSSWWGSWLISLVSCSVYKSKKGQGRWRITGGSRFFAS